MLVLQLVRRRREISWELASVLTLEEKVLRTLQESLTDKVANLPDGRRIQSPHVTP